jgi:phthiocerol/phenolphthiocerol synthesis type-I polyketide synthase E
VTESVSYDIAIIGMAGRFPCAENPEAFWEKIRGGVNCITYFDDDELRRHGVDERVLEDPNYVRAAPVLRDVDLFDAQFFALTPREAELMDPQQRLFLECCWEAFEDAGYDPTGSPGFVGLFAGARTDTYLANLLTHRDLMDSVGMFHLGLGNDLAFLTARVSHFLNLRGPTCSLHTACSTSLIAVHLACQSLLLDECHMALAGGVAVNVPHVAGYTYEEGSVQSPDGYCRAFDSAARGTIFGSGAGVVVLKRLQDALEDGDSIYSVIRGTAMNNDGSSKSSFTAPGMQGQVRVVREALRNARVSPESISYIECHATGTLLGDAIEVRALSKAFGAGKEGTCALGSVKSNVGHLDAAAGVAGLIKTTLCLRNRVLPPSLHFRQANPQIDFTGTPFYVNTSLRPWVARNGEPLRAGVSAFGVGGTNAHVVVEEAPKAAPGAPGRAWQLLPLSARSEKALGRMAGRLATHLQQHEDLELADVAYTLQVGRTRFDRRSTVVCSSSAEAIDLLQQVEAGVETWNITESDPDNPNPDQGIPSVAFLFPGQGAQYKGMASDLYKEEPVFRQHMDECSDLLRQHLGLELTQLLYGGSKEHDENLQQTWLTQPALLAVEFAMTKLWQSWGIKPDALLGHSLGEYTSACVSGVMQLEDALRLVAVRGRLMQQTQRGAMLGVGLGAQPLRDQIQLGGLDLAAINAPDLCTVAGPEEQIAELEKTLRGRNVNCHRLATSHAFHSRMIEGIIPEYLEELRNIKLRTPQIPFVSNVTGQWIKDEEAQDPSYWAAHTRTPVLFGKGIGELARDSNRIFLEVGPGQTLRRLVLRQPPENRGLLQLASLVTSGDDYRSMIRALGRMWEVGVDVDWKGFQTRGRRRVPLPTYPFERKRYWIEPELHRPLDHGSDARVHVRTDKLSSDMKDWFWMPSWRLGPPPPQAQHLSSLEQLWLVFLDDFGLAEEVCKELESKQARVVRVRRGSDFQELDTATFSLNPRAASDYSKLMNRMADAGLRVSHVIHFWSLDPDRNPPGEGLLREAALDTVLFAVQEVIRGTARNTCAIFIVSSGMVQIENSDPFVPSKSGILAFCRVVPQEHPNVECRSIDVTVPQTRDEFKDLACRLTAEMRGKTRDTLVAYRRKSRWVQCCEPLLLSEGSRQSDTELRVGGAYLMLGGLGGVALTIASQLARTPNTRLVLVTRWVFPPRQQWEELLGKTEDKTLAFRLRSLLTLEKEGAEIEVVCADISNEKALQQTFGSALKRFGRIDGVIHAAGMTHDRSVFCPVLETSMASFEVQAKPKLEGMSALRETLKDKDVGFVLLVSSNATVVGGLGFLSYAAANLFMAAHASLQCRLDQDTSWVCAHWDHWPEFQTSHDSLDLPFEESSVIRALEHKHLYAMTGEEAQQATLRIIRSAYSGEIFVSKGDLRQRLQAEQKHELAVPTQLDPPAMRRDLRNVRPRIKSLYVAPRNETEQQVAEIWKEFLGLERVGIHDDFFELGGHSLLATKLIAALRTTLKADLPLTKFLAAPTVANVAAILGRPLANAS